MSFLKQDIAVLHYFLFQGVTLRSLLCNAFCAAFETSENYWKVSAGHRHCFAALDT